MLDLILFKADSMHESTCPIEFNIVSPYEENSILTRIISSGSVFSHIIRVPSRIP